MPTPVPSGTPVVAAEPPTEAPQKGEELGGLAGEAGLSPA